jgi:hypothetical protein
MRPGGHSTEHYGFPNVFLKRPGTHRFWMILDDFGVQDKSFEDQRVQGLPFAYVACLARVLGKGFMLDPRSLLKQHMFVTQCHVHRFLQILMFFVLSSVVAVH